MNVLSLFDGMSCGQLALQKANIDVGQYFACGIDKHAVKCSSTKFPNMIHLGDVTEVDVDSLPKIDLLIGGSPCQGFSFLGKQLNFDDPRSKLFFEYSKILKLLKLKNPDIKFLLENVSMKKDYHKVISDQLGCEPIRINSELVSAQLRNRLYWTNVENVCVPDDKGICLNDILEYGTSERRKSLTLLASYGNKGTSIGSVNHYKNRSVGQLIPCELSKTGWRKLTLKEACRLQTVPDDYFDSVDVPIKEKYKMLGNGWTVDVIAHILQNLVVKPLT